MQAPPRGFGCAPNIAKSLLGIRYFPPPVAVLRRRQPVLQGGHEREDRLVTNAERLLEREHPGGRTRRHVLLAGVGPPPRELQLELLLGSGPVMVDPKPLEDR